jgi:hypothetical protein
MNVEIMADAIFDFALQTNMDEVRTGMPIYGKHWKEDQLLPWLFTNIWPM